MSMVSFKELACKSSEWHSCPENVIQVQRMSYMSRECHSCLENCNTCTYSENTSLTDCLLLSWVIKFWTTVTFQWLFKVVHGRQKTRPTLLSHSCKVLNKITFKTFEHKWQYGSCPKLLYRNCSETRLTELVHQSLRVLCFLDDALPVILSNGSTQLVIVHVWSIFSSPP